MSTPASSNFQFLAAHDTLLVALAAQAERSFAEDPVTCLMKLRQLAELLARRAAAHLGLDTSGPLPQAHLPRQLSEPPHSVLPADIRKLFDSLRVTGNTAVHEARADSAPKRPQGRRTAA